MNRKHQIVFAPVVDDGPTQPDAEKPTARVVKTKRVKLDPGEEHQLDEDRKKLLPGNSCHTEKPFMTKGKALAVSAVAMGCMFYLGWPSTPEAHAAAPQKAAEVHEPAVEQKAVTVKATEPQIEKRTCDFVNEVDGKCLPSTRFSGPAAEQLMKAEGAREAAAEPTEEKMDEFGNILQRPTPPPPPPAFATKVDHGKAGAVSVETMTRDRMDAKSHGLTLVNTTTMTGLSARSLARLMETEKSYVCEELPMVMERRLRGQQQLLAEEKQRHATDEEVTKLERFVSITDSSIRELNQFKQEKCQ